MNDIVLEWIDEKIKKIRPYERFGEDLFIVLMSLVSIFILVSMALSIKFKLSATAQNEFQTISSWLPQAGFFDKLGFLGSIISPAIQILAFMIIARELWKFRKFKWKNKELDSDRFFKKFSAVISKLEDFLNELLIALLSLGTVILIFYSVIILFSGHIEMNFLKGLVQAKYAAQSVYDWIVMLALIIIARESYLLKNIFLKKDKKQRNY